MSNVCKVCKKKQDKLTFYDSQGGGRYICRPCIKERGRKFRSTVAGKASVNLASRRAYEKNKEKWVARAKIHYAVKIGNIIKPKKCEVCGVKATGHALQGHHEDYSKPLEVIWLCTGCHADADLRLQNQTP